MAISFLKRDRDYVGYAPHKAPRYRKVERRGQVYRIEGVEVELFTLGTLAEAMDRTAHTIMMWEIRGLFPKPLFAVGGHRIKRWYSGAQILNLHKLMMEKYSGLKYLHEKEVFESFIKDAKAIFYHRSVLKELPP